MNFEEKWARFSAFLAVDALLSDERERINNPKRNEEKYKLLCETWENCYSLAKKYQGKIDGQDPDFPCSCHLVSLFLPTEDDEIILREIKSKLADAINNCDEVNIDTNIKGNLKIIFGFEDVYTSREV